MKTKFKQEMLFFTLLLCGITVAKRVNKASEVNYGKSKVTILAMRALAHPITSNYLKHYLK